MRKGFHHSVRLPAILAGLLIIWTLDRAYAGNSDKLWRLLERRDRANLKTNYVGVQMTTGESSQNVLSLTQITHRKPSLTLIRYKAPEFLAGMIVLDDGSESLHYIPQRQVLIAAPSDRSQAQTAIGLQQLQRLKANYAIRWAGKETFSNRSCFVLEIRPRYPGNPRRKLWVDAATGLELKTEKYNSRGQLALTTRFVEIDFPSFIPDEEVSLSPEARGLHKVSRSETPLDLSSSTVVAGFQALMPQYLPRGYAFLEASMVKAGRRQVVHLKFSDGMNTISLFERIVNPRQSNKGQSRNAWPGLSACVKEWKVGHLKLTLMSDLPEEEVEKIAASVGAF